MIEAISENNPKKVVTLLVRFLKDYTPDKRTIELVN